MVCFFNYAFGCKTIVFHPDDESLNAANAGDGVGLSEDGSSPGASTPGAIDQLHAAMKSGNGEAVDLQDKAKVYVYDPYDSITKVPAPGSLDKVNATGNIKETTLDQDNLMDDIKERGTIFIYSQPMKDTRHDVPHQFLNIDQMPKNYRD